MLFPEQAPYAVHRLAVTPPHVLYLEECGRADGIPVLFVHGGPGAGCEPYHRRFFNPERFRVVLFDQRGAGRSEPHASLEGNDTASLVADMERIREHLGISQWLLFGGSWGSTLSLVYAQTHPERVLGLVLRGIFLCRPEEIRWFYQEGAHWIFPEFWQDYLAPIPVHERADLVSAYYRRLTSGDAKVREQAARAWSLWEARTSTLIPKPELLDHFTSRRTSTALARIECHYFMHQSFLAENQILRDVGRLAEIPGIIVHGRYDCVCPPRNAWELHEAWPSSRLQITPRSGHSALEAENMEALVAATETFSRTL